MAASKDKFCTRENGVYYFEKIIEVLNTWKNIEEFDIIPSVKPENNSCPFVLDANKLGIFSWCVKGLFHYAYGQLMEATKSKCVSTGDEGACLMNLSQVVLLLHSEDYKIWNLRKCYITNQIKKYARDELDFSALVLRKHPRSTETFSHSLDYLEANE